MFLWRGQLRVAARIYVKVYERKTACLLSLRITTDSSLRYFSTSFSKTVCRSNLLLALSSKMSCPGNRMRWNLTPNEILAEADNLMVKSKSVYDTIGGLSADEVNYDNIIRALAEDTASYQTSRNLLDFAQHVSPCKELREASVAADKKLSEFDVEISMREDVFKNLLAAEQKFGATLKPEGKRYLERLIKLGRRNGLHLSKEVQNEVKEIKKLMSDLSIDFSKNLNEENTVLEFTSQELEGLPVDILNGLDKTDDGRYKVSLKYPHYFPCMKFVRDPAVRMKLETAFNSSLNDAGIKPRRGPGGVEGCLLHPSWFMAASFRPLGGMRRCMKENTAILEQLVTLRQKKADLLSFPTHSAFVLDMRMAKDTQRVATFLSDLRTKLVPLKEDEMRLFLDYKREDCDKYGYTFDNKINMWDMRYYMTRVEERKYVVDQNKLKEYFPLSVVTKGLLDIYQELLSLEFDLVQGAEAWHPDVTLYSVKDKATASLIGYFYLDLFPREGKYGHAACFGLQPGCEIGDGVRQVTVAAMVANFTKPTSDQPSLLTHDEVETYFHEFGHVMHQICAESQFALFSGTAVERDFVEAPSQMLENWCWERESLTRMSAHYKDGSAIPDDLLIPLLNSRKANAGVFNLRQILLATFDQTIHTSAKANTAELFDELSRKILGIPSTENTNMSASFGHLAGGYDAQYYGYLWSEVFSADMFHSRFKVEGIMNSKVGMDYRSCILKPGGSVDADEMIRKFLGREAQPEAFLRSKGLEL